MNDVLALKGNHPTLHSQVKDWFEQSLAFRFEGITNSYDERIEKGHHCTEKRFCWCVSISQLPQLNGVRIHDLRHFDVLINTGH